MKYKDNCYRTVVQQSAVTGEFYVSLVLNSDQFTRLERVIVKFEVSSNERVNGRQATDSKANAPASDTETT